MFSKLKKSGNMKQKIVHMRYSKSVTQHPAEIVSSFPACVLDFTPEYDENGSQNRVSSCPFERILKLQSLACALSVIWAHKNSKAENLKNYGIATYKKWDMTIMIFTCAARVLWPMTIKVVRTIQIPQDSRYGTHGPAHAYPGWCLIHSVRAAVWFIIEHENCHERFKTAFHGLHVLRRAVHITQYASPWRVKGSGLQIAIPGSNPEMSVSTKGVQLVIRTLIHSNTCNMLRVFHTHISHFHVLTVAHILVVGYLPCFTSF